MIKQKIDQLFSFFESIIDPYPSHEPQQPPDNMFAFFWHYARHAWGTILSVSLLGALFAIFEIYVFSFLGNIVDWLSTSDRETFLADEGGQLVWMFFIIMIVLPFGNLIHSLFHMPGLLGNYGMLMRWLMHRYLLRQSMGFFADEFAGRVATKVMQTSLAVRDATATVMDVMVFVTVYFFGGVILVFTLHPVLALPFLFWLMLYALMLRFFLPRMAVISKRQADARSLMTGRVVDSYTNITTVKLFAHAEREEDYAKGAMNEFMKTVYPQMRLSAGLEFSIAFINGFLLVGAGAAGIGLWLYEGVTVGAVAVAIGLVLRLQGMSHWIMWELARLFESLGVVQDGMNMLSKPHTILDAPEAGDLEASGKPISFENIKFNYGGDGNVIDNLSLTIKPGEKIGLVGRSGAGKTTLTNVLLRFYELDGGAVKIGDQDITQVKQNSLRGNIGMVTQDTSLLHRSVRDNIAYSRPSASDAEIIEAAKKANAWDFIDGLADNEGNRGLDAMVGERGVKLSGGQRQRIAIARIFLKDAPILVLDEATSALDSEVEAAIQESLFELMEGKTVIAIAHRLSTIAKLDRLIIMDEGAIIEEGSHEELLEKQGVYADLWARQSGGFIASEK